MSHEIDFSKGYAAMFSVRVPVWHQAETGAKRLAVHPTVEAALIEAGLDFIVEKVPTYRLALRPGAIPGSPVGAAPVPEYRENALAFSTIRTDTGAELGMVGRDYTPLQNVDALRIFQPLLDSGHCVIETAGALRGGADVWVAIAWNLDKFSEQARALFQADPRGLLPYSVIRNNHNGRSNVVGMDVTICPVCANTLGFALSDAGSSETEAREGRVSGNAFAVKHSQNVRENVEAQAAAMWTDRVALFDLIAAQYALLKRTTLDAATFARCVLDVAAPDPRSRRGWNPEARMAETVLERFETKRTVLRNAWTQGSGHTGDGSAWEAYNGLVEVIDHNSELYPTRSGVYRTQALLDGELGRIKQTVVNRLVRFAQDGEPQQPIAGYAPRLLTAGGQS